MTCETALWPGGKEKPLVRIPGGQFYPPGLFQLRRLQGEGDEAVVLIHGATAGHQTFLDAERGGIPLACHLHDLGYDVWLLDWRASLNLEQYEFTLDVVSDKDLPAAFEIIHETANRPIHVIAHCMGAAVMAQAIATDLLPASLRRVVLSAIGLFYEVPLTSALLARTRALEHMAAHGHRAISPIRPFPWPMSSLYRAFELSPLRPGCDHELCHRLAAMFGLPFRHDLPRRRGERFLGDHQLQRWKLENHFGPLDLTMYLHGVQNIRRGWAAKYDYDPQRNLIEYDYRADCDPSLGPPDYLDPEPFRRLERITLISGALNQIWFPESISRMYDWLRNHLGPDQVGKRIFQDFAHQDMFWARSAPKIVYPYLGLGGQS